jgi:sterol desaturase/sphingolipid hydroxylase (fatty acid hydroxylase superfamily)
MQTTLPPPRSAVSIPPEARPFPGPRLTPAGRRLVGIALFVGMLIAAVAGLQPAGLYVLGVLISMPLERLFKRHQQDILRREYRTDLLHLFLTPVLTIALGIIPLVVVLVALSPVPTLANAVASQPRWLQFLEVLIIGDLAGYWLHRAQHEVGFLWRFHKIHHSIRTMDWLAGNRNYAGLFPAWDIMFGSYYTPKDLRPTEYGVHEDVPSGWWAQMKHPLKHS